MDCLKLKAAIEAVDFEKEMRGLGYPFKVYELPCLEYCEYGTYVSFPLTEKAIRNDYEAIRFEREGENDCREEYIRMLYAQADMRKDLRTWVNDEDVLIHFVWQKGDIYELLFRSND